MGVLSDPFLRCGEVLAWHWLPANRRLRAGKPAFCLQGDGWQAVLMPRPDIEGAPVMEMQP